MKRWQVITIISIGLVAGSSFYFLFLRKRKGVSQADADKISQYKVVLNPEANQDTSISDNLLQ